MMEPYYTTPDGQAIYCGDVREVLKALPDESVQMCVTSPPYFGLRDYGTAEWDGGDPRCEHTISGWNDNMKPDVARPERDGEKRKACLKCGARRVDRQIGLEPTPAAFVEVMVEVFREVKRVLRKDGTLWLNLGDSYAGSWGNYAPGGIKGVQRERTEEGKRWERPAYGNDTTRKPATAEVPGLKPKDLIGIPWRCAFALQDDGWWLRSAITWCKRAPMPESVTDRPTSATEMIFLFTKSATYYYDAEAVREPSTPDMCERAAAGRNMWNYWLLSPEPYPGTHYATYPSEIPRRAILAGTSEQGCCPKCGRPWKRVVERETVNESNYVTKERGTATSTGFRAACKCEPADPIPCVVLDPFLGSGTSLLVARQLGRRGIGIELNAKTVDEDAIPRIEGQTLSLFQ